MQVFIQKESFDVGAHYDFLVRAFSGAAVVTFTGYVREYCDQGDLTGLELEHYPAMTERRLQELGEEAAARFDLKTWRIVHRYGRLEVTDPIVWAGVVADHRGAAFDGCQFIMDTLKTDVPFWKREYLSNGKVQWVEAKNNDNLRRQRWR